MLTCEVEAEAHIPYFMDIEERGKLAQSVVSFSIDSEGMVENDLDYFVTLDIEPTRGDTNSFADITVTLVNKENKTVKAGDNLYDEEVDVSINWKCEGSTAKTKNIAVAAGKANATLTELFCQESAVPAMH